MKSFRTFLFGKGACHDLEVQFKQVEDYPTGYPQFSTLIASHGSFQIYRRFARLRARSLLLKQDKLAALEMRLDEIDANERAPLFLGSCRDDANAERSRTILEIDHALEDYDNSIERSTRTLESCPPEPRDVRSLQNWVNNNGCLSWAETEYLTHYNDLRRLVRSKDDAVNRFEGWVEDGLVRLMRKHQADLCGNLSRDQHVFIPSTPFVGIVARILVVLLIIIMISLPIIICVFVESSSARVAVIVLSLILFLFVLSAFITVKTHELVLAAATYTTVLVVFVSESNVRRNAS
ncbi:hypothetical protein CC86DRAFT_450014 [Ophiobolus disseminans]|uniref:DUF6594 domain-containing protein n=1 Tax=Ophiobolus disseminans TaxID=1469910 RepID=A0A6A6ZEH0_9PLEO|nr:hypothetical protein CC86DRAFT_450014 [Ophiobolus disseminans]